LNRSLDNARNLYLDGRVGEAITILRTLETRAGTNHLHVQQIAELYLQCGQHESAGRCYARSVRLQPSNPEYLYNLAASRTALGDLEKAEALYTEVIRLNPEDHGAWLNRSALRTQTDSSNHVQQLEYVKSHLGQEDSGQVQICYALAKELEDLGRHGESFSFLQEGAHRRRKAMQYDIREDETTMRAIAASFNEALLKRAEIARTPARPIFVLGLPRSGTTLVDRIISSHSLVGSLGEHNTLPLALMRMVRESSGSPGGGPADKIALSAQSANVDFPELGRRYLESIDGFGNSAERLVDKTPLNFLYIGLIRLALPGARIIHLQRHPMDSCYAIYKTLFRAGYPYSYSLQETGRYYIAYHRLMDHWRRSLPDGFLDVHYEDLVFDPESETRRLLDHLGLDWEESCLQFHQQHGPAATASAAQVRRPIYSSSVGLWRKYSDQLAPLAGKLRERGIRLDRDRTAFQLK
jgi:tetratricopeptide (TPR) repeat protein